jgi:hypothetical protein
MRILLNYDVAVFFLNFQSVDEVKYLTTWSAVDGRPFARTNTVPVDDRANWTKN